METLKFKTNIKCSGCIATASSYLNEAAGENNWTVDIQNPDKILSVTGSEDISASEIVKAVQDAGFKAEKIH